MSEGMEELRQENQLLKEQIGLLEEQIKLLQKQTRLLEEQTRLLGDENRMLRRRNAQLEERIAHLEKRLRNRRVPPLSRAGGEGRGGDPPRVGICPRPDPGHRAPHHPLHSLVALLWSLGITYGKIRLLLWLQHGLRVTKAALMAMTRRVPYHTNGVEREIRPCVVARKNSYGSHSRQGARSLAAWRRSRKRSQISERGPPDLLRGGVWIGKGLCHG